MIMNIAKSIAFAALLASASAQNGLRPNNAERQLQDTDGLCGACELCTTLGDFCALQDLVTLACDSCANFGIDGLCDACTVCTEAGDLCDAGAVFDVACSLTCEDGGGDNNAGNPDIGTCFSEVSTVQVEHLGSVTMKDLKLGAKVLTQSGAFEPVYAFGHRNPTKSAEFLQFQTKESSLEMTAGHLVFLEGKADPVRADSIKEGDVFQGKNAKVLKINTVHRDGLYSPLTPSGTVVVDGIAASTYISLQKDSNEFVELQGGLSTFMSFHNGIHMVLSPFRMFTMGVSSSLGNIYTEDGIPLYASYGMDIAQWVNNQNIVIQFILFLAVGALAGASMFVENTVGASAGPLVLVAGAGAYALMQKNGITFRSKTKSV